MKNSNIIFVLIGFFMLQSCTVTRSRYGNGLKVEFINAGGKDKSTAQAPKATKRQKEIKSKKTEQTISKDLHLKTDSSALSSEFTASTPAIENTIEFKKDSSKVKKSFNILKKTNPKNAYLKIRNKLFDKTELNEPFKSEFVSQKSNKKSAEIKQDSGLFLFDFIDDLLTGLAYLLFGIIIVSFIILLVVDPILALEIILTIIFGGLTCLCC